MSEQRVGTCSQCGGDVMGYRGIWMSVQPPPPDRCSHCGATRVDDVIQMVPKRDDYCGWRPVVNIGWRDTNG